MIWVTNLESIVGKIACVVSMVALQFCGRSRPRGCQERPVLKRG